MAENNFSLQKTLTMLLDEKKYILFGTSSAP